MMANKIRLILLLPLLMLYGCASLSPADLHVLDPSRAYTQSDIVGLLYKAPGFSVGSDVDVILLHPVKVKMKSIATSGGSKQTMSNGRARSLETIAREFAENLENGLEAAIPRETHLSLIRPGESVPDGLNTVALTIVVTELDPGSGFARWFIGAGAGATKVQIEGGIKDSNDTVVLAFADKRTHSGNPTLGLNFAAMSDEYTLTALKDEFVEAVIRLLRSQ